MWKDVLLSQGLVSAVATNTIVLPDGSGNFSAGTMLATLPLTGGTLSGNLTMCLQCSVRVPVFPIRRKPKYCPDCYFQGNYCRWCMSFDTGFQRSTIYVCEGCSESKKNTGKHKCKRESWNKCNLQPRFPLLNPAVCHKHFTKNIRKNTVMEFSSLQACCRCGIASSSIYFEAYSTPKYSALRVCEGCSFAVTVENAKKRIPINALAEIVATYLFSGNVFPQVVKT